MVRIDLLAFVDFVLCGGLGRLALAGPRRGYDFWRPWTKAIREGGGIIGAEVAAGEDLRRRRIYPRHADALIGAVSATNAELADPPPSNAIALGDLSIDLVPDLALRVAAETVDVFLWHRVEPLSAERCALILAATKLVGMHAGLIDLQHPHETPLVMSAPTMPNPNDITALFAAEAKTFLALRARAEARAK